MFCLSYIKLDSNKVSRYRIICYWEIPSSKFFSNNNLPLNHIDFQLNLSGFFQGIRVPVQAIPTRMRCYWFLLSASPIERKGWRSHTVLVITLHALASEISKNVRREKNSLLPLVAIFIERIRNIFYSGWILLIQFVKQYIVLQCHIRVKHSLHLFSVLSQSSISRNIFHQVGIQSGPVINCNFKSRYKI